MLNTAAGGASESGNSRAHRFLRIGEVVRASGLPPSTIYEMAAKGTFPKQVRLSPRAVGWLEHEVLAWQEALIAERDGEAR
jgi:prophage regulatory protein